MSKTGSTDSTSDTPPEWRGQAVSDRDVMEYLVAAEQRLTFQNRIWWIGLGSWLMILAASVTGCFFAFQMMEFAHTTFSDLTLEMSGSAVDRPWQPRAVAIALCFCSVIIAVSLLFGLLLSRLPGTVSASQAFDWGNVCDAMSRLVAVGNPYPIAFRTTASLVRSSFARNWLVEIAQKMERGYSGSLSQIRTGAEMSGDLAMLCVLVDHSRDDPQQGWIVAKQYFDLVSRRRFEVARIMLPVLSTLIAGWLIWISMAGTLGWIWMGIRDLIENNLMFW